MLCSLLEIKQDTVCKVCLALSQCTMSRSGFVAVEKGLCRTEASEMEKGGSYPPGMPTQAQRPATVPVFPSKGWLGLLLAWQ